MARKLHICLDGLNLGLLKGTGIATYARHLGDCLYQEEHEISILFDKNLDENVSESQYEKSFYASMDQLSEKERRPRASMAHYILIPYYFFKSLYYFLRCPRAKKHVFLANNNNEAVKKRLPGFTSIYNSRGFYRLAQCYFMLFDRLLPIKLSPAPDIMHWTCPIPARVVGAKNYYTVHDLIPLRLPYATQENKKRFYKMLKKIAKSSDKIITVSECSRQDIMHYLSVPAEKVVNTYQSVSVEKFETESLPCSLLPKSYFLFVGAIEPKKNIARLLEAFIKTNVSQKLVVVGSLSWQSEKEKFLLEQYEGRVVYLNYVSKNMLSNLMNNARALVFPSLYEGFGLPVVEAMSMDLPVITSSTSCLPEITADAAYLVDPYEIREISAAIIRLAEDDALCAKLAEKARKRAEAFNQEAYIQRLKSVYNFC